MTYPTVDDDVIVFDPKTNSAPRAASGPVPAGRWDVEVAEINTKHGPKGPYQQMVFEVIKGEHTMQAGDEWIGSRIWCNQGWLYGDLCAAVGLQKVNPQTGAPDPDGVYLSSKGQMLRMPVVIDLVADSYKDHNTGKTKPSNKVTGIYDPDALPVPATLPAPVAPQPVPPLDGVNNEAELAF